MAIATIALLTVAPHDAVGREPRIQPGAPFVLGGENATQEPLPTTKIATLGFVFTDRQGRLYIQAPAHAVRGSGSEVYVPVLGKIGTVAFWRDGGRTLSCHATHHCSDDFALVAIDEEHYGEVDPSVRLWGGPAGVARVSEVKPGDPVVFYGQAQGIREAARPRAGVVLRAGGDGLSAAMPFGEGDSGGPFVHVPTGRALATFAFLQPDGLPILGPTVERMLEAAAAEGFELRLLTAP